MDQPLRPGWTSLGVQGGPASVSRWEGALAASPGRPTPWASKDSRIDPKHCERPRSLLVQAPPRGQGPALWQRLGRSFHVGSSLCDFLSVPFFMRVSWGPQVWAAEEGQVAGPGVRMPAGDLPRGAGAPHASAVVGSVTPTPHAGLLPGCPCPRGCGPARGPVPLPAASPLVPMNSREGAGRPPLRTEAQPGAPGRGRGHRGGAGSVPGSLPGREPEQA